ncbi:MAG: hypothetical protein K2O45_08420 [Oscillospiraceae bacterium]|nr:hypothetical protein [Oscillospiraceae bacterium]
MSMTISAASYLNSISQTTRSSSEEKQEQKSVPVEVGKTQQSAVSASLDRVNMGQDGIAVTEVGRQQGAEQSAAQKRSAAPQTDTVEISAEGKAASVKSREQMQDGAAALEETQYGTEDLSVYTDAELKQMYYKGEITRQEYEDETGEALQ